MVEVFDTKLREIADGKTVSDFGKHIYYEKVMNRIQHTTDELWAYYAMFESILYLKDDFKTIKACRGALLALCELNDKICDEMNLDWNSEEARPDVRPFPCKFGTGESLESSLWMGRK